MFGIGLQGEVEKSGVYNSPHNAIQEIILCWGIIGFIIIVAFILVLLNYAYKQSDDKKSLLFSFNDLWRVYSIYSICKTSCNFWVACIISCSNIGWR